MTMLGKRGPAVLDAPAASYALETDWEIPEPAPPGTLHYAGGASAFPSQPHNEGEPWPSQNVPSRYRLRIGVPSSKTGKIALGAGIMFVLGVVCAGLQAARYSVLHDEKFLLAASSRIEIEGNHHLTRSQVLGVFAPDLQRNIFRAPLAQRQADLQRLPWVAHATVMRLLPDRVRVQIVERAPVAFVRQGTQIGLADASGVLLDMPQDAAGDPHYSFPVLTGISSSDPISTRAARMEIYRRFMSEIDSSGEKFSQSLSEVDVSNPEDVKALIASGSTDILVHFGEENFLERFRVFEQNLPQWKTQYPRLAAVDTRYEHQLVLEMSQPPEPPATIADASTPAQLPPALHAAPKADPKHVGAKPVATKSAAEAHKPVSSHSASAHGPVKP